MLEYTSRQITQLTRQYEMFLRSLDILASEEDKAKMCIQMSKIEEKLLVETNSLYEEKYMSLLEQETFLISEEKERLLKLIKLIEDRINYIKDERKKHKEITGYAVAYPNIMGEDRIGELKRKVKIIDKFSENLSKENVLNREINELDDKISEAVKKIKNNKYLNTSLEKKMISLLSRIFNKLDLYKLADQKDIIEAEYNELEYSLIKAKENVKKAKSKGREDLIIECDSLLSSVTLSYEQAKEKKYTLKLIEIFDNAISDYDDLLAKREEMNDILVEISNSYLYGIIGDELNKQYNTIKIEKQDMNTYETLTSEREAKYNELEKITDENNSREFREVLDVLIENEKKRQEELLQEQRKKEYEERQRKLIEEKREEDEKRRKQNQILEERKKSQEQLTKRLLEEQKRFTSEKKIEKDNKEEKIGFNSVVASIPKEKKEDTISFNSMLEVDSIPIIKNNNLKPEIVGSEKPKKENRVLENDMFRDQEDIFPPLKENLG